VPVGDVLVRDTGGDIEHDNTALAVDVVSISQTTELLLASCVPYIELNRSQVLSRKVSRLADAKWNDQSGVVGGAYGSESERVHFDTESCDVLLFEFTSKMALDEGGLHGMNVSDPARSFRR
jgi:hypothetical protein